MRSISSAAAFQAMSSVIGCKPNANSSERRGEKQPDCLSERGRMKRRDFIKDGAVSALAVSTAHRNFEPETLGSGRSPISLRQADSKGPFWPEGARLVISISMQMEAGAQPPSGAASPLPRIDSKYPDIAATKWYEYGFKEGLP